MSPRLLLDTHVLLNWLFRPKRLLKEQRRVIEAASDRGEPMALAATTLLEVAILITDGELQLKSSLGEFLQWLEDNPVFRIMPLNAAIATEAGSMVQLRDPADRAITATARVHGLRLVTSDHRIIDSNLVSTIE